MLNEQVAVPKFQMEETHVELELIKVNFRHTRGGTPVYVIRKKGQSENKGRFFLTKLVSDKVFEEVLCPGSWAHEVNPLFYGRTYDDMLAFFERQV